jgi:hypothetical protein
LTTGPVNNVAGEGELLVQDVGYAGSHGLGGLPIDPGPPIPPFFEELRLPGEQQVVRGIVAARDELERLEGQRADLTKYKHLGGHFPGEQLRSSRSSR